MPRLVCPSWRWMTISGTPSRAISTACAWRSWCGAKRRRTPASRATRRSSQRAAAAAHGRPRVAPLTTQKQRPDRQLHPRVAARARAAPTPSRPCRPRGGGRPCRAAPAATATRVEVGLGERERLADPQAGAPEHDDQAAQAAAVDAVAGAAHHGDDLLDRRWIRGVAHPLVARSGRPAWKSGRVAGERRRPAASSSSSDITPPRESETHPSLLPATSGAPAARPRSYTQARRLARARPQSAPPANAAARSPSDDGRREFPRAWKAVANRSLPLSTDAGAP